VRREQETAEMVFSNHWKTWLAIFPNIGKIGTVFSNDWKTRGQKFPMFGKIRAIFFNHWKNGSIE
jgi:hypothetical protein